MAAGNFGLKSLSTEGVNKIHFSSSPSEYFILFHWCGFSDMYISEPIIITREMEYPEAEGWDQF